MATTRRSDSDRPVWVGYEGLAAELGLKTGHLKALVARKKMPVWRLGRLVRFHLPTVERWLLAAANADAADTSADEKIAAALSGSTP